MYLLKVAPALAFLATTANASPLPEAQSFPGDTSGVPAGGTSLHYSGSGCTGGTIKTTREVGENPNPFFYSNSTIIHTTLTEFALYRKTQEQDCEVTLKVKGEPGIAYMLVSTTYRAPLKISDCGSAINFAIDSNERVWNRHETGSDKISGLFPSTYRDSDKAFAAPAEEHDTEPWCKKYKVLKPGAEVHSNGVGVNPYYSNFEPCGADMVGTVKLDVSSSGSGKVTWGFDGKKRVGTDVMWELARKNCTPEVAV